MQTDANQRGDVNIVMQPRKIHRRLALCCVGLFILSSIPFTSAQDTSALINEALDKPIKMDINATLPQAIDQIADKTGVRIDVESQVWSLLPWGRDTNITAKIDNQTLRQALDAITRKLGLNFVLTQEAVELRPMPALQRLARRATVQELNSLNLLRSNQLGLSSAQPTVDELLSAVDKRLQDLKSGLAIDNRAEDVFTPNQTVPVARNATLGEALESLARNTRATWYPWGKSIVIISKVDEVGNQLSKTITIRYNGVDLSQVLMELSQRAGVPFDIQPGAIQQISPQFRSIRLFLDEATIKQALDAISGFTGLSYSITEQGVYFWNNASQQNQAAGEHERVLGILRLPDGFEVLVPESQVPEDVRQYLKLKTRQEIQNLRQRMKAEGFKPTTQPTTHSVENQQL